MLKDVTFGQYYPGNSLLHRTDPRVKIILLIEYLVLVLAATTPHGVALTVAVTLFLVAVSGINAKVLLKSVKPLIFVLVFTGIINLFFTRGTGEPLVALGFMKIYREGIINASIMLLRLLSLVIGSGVLLSFTTAPLDLTDALESLLSPLKALLSSSQQWAMARVCTLCGHLYQVHQATTFTLTVLRLTQCSSDSTQAI